MARPELEPINSIRPDPHTFFDRTAGTIAIGDRGNGTAAQLELYGPEGALPCRITGAPGTGVELLLNHLWATEAAIAVVRPLAVDLTGAHHENPHLRWVACTEDEAPTLLSDIFCAAHTRIERGSTGATLGYLPTSDQPLISLTLIRLSHLGDHLLDRVKALSQLARRGGVSLRATDHPGDLPPTTVNSYFETGSRIELGDGPHGARRCTGRVRGPFSGPVQFRTWQPTA
ncbi:hypothetical protein LN042_24105 [Kitasatospora sp. RB6PN24]|uniref:hypothetical protein n=1 Tax=Kitasatospora humi TaxID=2893891 RepID=UPI001E2BB6C7|nr:hypothetical protein [Kitasatospora humi]MCC9310113.1 hypothetical protein [Kitasatospora humi]